MSTIEEQLWDYIDGNLDERQASAIKKRIETDQRFRAQYEELLGLNSLIGNIELDEPSMSFTRNVMDHVALEKAPIIIKTKVNKYIVYGIAGFFVISLLAIFGYTLWHVKIDFADVEFSSRFDLNIENYINSTTIYALLFIDLVMGLLFLDYFLRRKMSAK